MISELEALFVAAAAALFELLLQGADALGGGLARALVERDGDEEVAAALGALGEERGGKLDLRLLVLADVEDGRAAVLDAVYDGARALRLGGLLLVRHLSFTSRASGSRWRWRCAR